MPEPRILVNFYPNDFKKSVGSCRSLKEFGEPEKVVAAYKESLEGLFKNLIDLQIIKNGELKIELIND